MKRHKDASATLRTLAVAWMLALCGCQSVVFGDGTGDGPPFARAIIEPGHVEEAIRIEKKELEPFYNVPPKAGESWFAILPGTSRVLVVAPHATKVMRDGKLRFADAGTGSLAVMLNRLAKTTVIYTTRASPSDPNFYDDNDFKRELAKLVRELKPVLVLDLHGSHQYRPYDVDFGTMGGTSLLGKEQYLRELAQALRREGLINLSQDFFAASKDQTVTKWVAGLGVPCIQVKITSTRLVPGASNLEGHRFSQLLQALVRFVRMVDTQQ